MSWFRFLNPFYVSYHVAGHRIKLQGRRLKEVYLGFIKRGLIEVLENDPKTDAKGVEWIRSILSVRITRLFFGL